MGTPLRGTVLPGMVEKGRTGVRLPVWITAGTGSSEKKSLAWGTFRKARRNTVAEKGLPSLCLWIGPLGHRLNNLPKVTNKPGGKPSN